MSRNIKNELMAGQQELAPPGEILSASLTDFLASQDQLVREAALALPQSFSHCTFALGEIRQSVYLCLTCREPRGICSACSIACHTDHEQVELFPKRHFRCDCPTTALSHPCTLHRTKEPINPSNTYGQNFKGVFCRCTRPYDPNTELETMIQCLACEDWFHESCLNLRERPDPQELAGADPPPQSAGSESEHEHDDAASDASSSGLPPPLIQASDYETLICGSCVSNVSTLKRWAATPGVLMVVRDSPSTPWKVMGQTQESSESNVGVELEQDNANTSAGTKRGQSPSSEDLPEAKRTRLSSPSLSRCLAPASSPLAQEIIAVHRSMDEKSSLGRGDIFLTDGWRERWCRCSSCLPSLEGHPYLLEEEETYEPPADPDSGLSLEELGMRALQSLPRDRAIDGIHAFNEMRDDLVKFLRPFAQEGKVVNEADVRSFFDSLRESTGNAQI